MKIMQKMNFHFHSFFHIIFQRRLMAWLFAMIWVFSFLPLTAWAAEYDLSEATYFLFSDDGIDVSGVKNEGYEISDTALTIHEAGTYVVSGQCQNGSIKIKKGTAGVTLVLNGLNLTSAETAPITCGKSSVVTLVAASDTVNTLTDTAYNNNEKYPENLEAENAVFKAKDGSQVTICGTGTLNILANGKNGIKSGLSTDEDGEAWMIIRDVTLNITAAVNDGINAGNSLSIISGNLMIDALGDGIHSDYRMQIGESGTDGPTIHITRCDEGLEAANMDIFSGCLTIHAKDDCINAANSSLARYAFTLNIAGGMLYMDTTAGDGIDSNGTLTISGGTVEVWTASSADNQPLDADGEISITGGVIFVSGGSAGMGMNLNTAQAYVVFGSGAMGGMGGMGGMHGKDFPNDQSGNRPEWIPDDQRNNRPEGVPGNRSEGKGLLGGEASPSAFTQTGAGSLTDTQAAVNIIEGSSITIEDAAGNKMYQCTASCNARYVFFSSPDLSSDDTYTLTSDNIGIASAISMTTFGNTTSGLIPGEKPGMPGELPADPGNQVPGFEEKETVPSTDIPSASDAVTNSAASDDSDSDGLHFNGNNLIWIPLLLLGVGVSAGIVIYVWKKKKINISR